MESDPFNIQQRSTLTHQKVLQVAEEIGYDPYVRLYIKQLERSLITKPKLKAGGVTPLVVDPDTGEAYCLLGLSRSRRPKAWSPQSTSEYYCHLPDHRIVVRDTLCNFHGWMDVGETSLQGKAREGYEESRGVFGSLVDIWRCLSLPGYSYEMPCLPAMNLISLGRMGPLERSNLVQKFLSCPIHSPCMAETRGIRFIPLKELYRALRRSKHFKTPTSMTLVSPAEYPYDNVWLRGFLQNWLTDPIIGPMEVPRSVVDVEGFPREVFSNWHGRKLSLDGGSEASRGEVCYFCGHPLRDVLSPYLPSYACPPSPILGTKETKFFHVHCIMWYNGATKSWELKDDDTLCMYHRFKFFEDPVVKKLMEGGGFPLRSIFELPPVEERVGKALERMLLISQEVDSELRGGNKQRSRLRLVDCQGCGDKVYVKGNKVRCVACENLEHYSKFQERKNY
eukprot:TRINITY_DN7395_c0_g1_i2.p1 TRINITY_DN7395_c0_g1~~TRINITY_DN7395_c0_g1_i2.p1  ORF type:complete len:451 (+),score=78.23 TRINITY_DN7395_c0_g1_i2:94-1446(+)